MNIFRGLLAAIIVCSISSAALAQDKPMSPEEKAWGAYMTPGPMHDWLKASEGMWKVTTTTWMKPGDPPMTSEGEAEIKAVLGGRYMQTQMHGMMMGQPYEGIGYDGYDNALGEFVSTWIDNMGTGVMEMHGKIDASKKVISYQGKVVDPMSKKQTDMWATTTIVDPDHEVMEMFSMNKGKKIKTMELKMERRK